MQRGYVKLFRKSVDNPLFRKPLAWHYFTYCLIKANHKPARIIWNKEEMIIDRGSFITGRKQAALETGLTEQNIRTIQKLLISLGIIEKSTSKSTSKFTYLTICNYSIYQTEIDIVNQQTNQQLTSNQPATNHRQELIKTTKNKKTVSFEPEIKEIIDFFNATCGTRITYKNKAVNAVITKRLKGKMPIEDFKTIVIKKNNQWGGDEKMFHNLTPTTLFADKHFQNYLEELEKPNQSIKKSATPIYV